MEATATHHVCYGICYGIALYLVQQLEVVIVDFDAPGLLHAPDDENLAIRRQSGMPLDLHPPAGLIVVVNAPLGRHPAFGEVRILHDLKPV
jgi:hypothetical protein